VTIVSKDAVQAVLPKFRREFFSENQASCETSSTDQESSIKRVQSHQEK